VRACAVIVTQGPGARDGPGHRRQLTGPIGSALRDSHCNEQLRASMRPSPLPPEGEPDMLEGTYAWLRLLGPSSMGAFSIPEAEWGKQPPTLPLRHAAAPLGMEPPSPGVGVPCASPSRRLPRGTRTVAVWATRRVATGSPQADQKVERETGAMGPSIAGHWWGVSFLGGPSWRGRRGSAATQPLYWVPQEREGYQQGLASPPPRCQSRAARRRSLPLVRARRRAQEGPRARSGLKSVRAPPPRKQWSLP